MPDPGHPANPDCAQPLRSPEATMLQAREMLFCVESPLHTTEAWVVM